MPARFRSNRNTRFEPVAPDHRWELVGGFAYAIFAPLLFIILAILAQGGAS